MTYHLWTCHPREDACPRARPATASVCLRRPPANCSRTRAPAWPRTVRAPASAAAIARGCAPALPPTRGRTPARPPGHLQVLHPFDGHALFARRRALQRQRAGPAAHARAHTRAPARPPAPVRSRTATRHLLASSRTRLATHRPRAGARCSDRAPALPPTRGRTPARPAGHQHLLARSRPPAIRSRALAPAALRDGSACCPARSPARPGRPELTVHCGRGRADEPQATSIHLPGRRRV